MAPAIAKADVIQLLLPVRLPDYLDRDAMLVRRGAAELIRIEGYRWAEPLALAVPRVLRADLLDLLGEGRLWTAPLPAGLRATQQWRIEVTAFEADELRRRVHLGVNWTRLDSAGPAAPPLMRSIRIEQVADDEGPSGLAAAHRLALRELARRLVRGSSP